MKNWKSRRTGTGLVLVLTLFSLLALFVLPAAAQNYSFSVLALEMQVYVQSDGSARIVYDITFKNNPDAHLIDIVDIGMPHGGYDIRNMKASLDGVELNDIRRSQYVDPGVEVHLGRQFIAPGEQGTLHFELTMPDLVFQDTTRKDYASLKITPTWFGSELVTGTSDIQIAIHMLPGIEPEEMLYQKTPFTAQAIFQEHAVAAWRWEKGSATRSYLVGVSFPTRGLTNYVRISRFELLVKSFEETPLLRFWATVGYLLLFCFLFFRFSGGTGISVFVVLAGGLIWLFAANPAAHLLAFLPLPVLIYLNERGLSRRRKRYLPAVAQVEGGGIKRGLTAPEAAVLLEMPINKVLTLVIFGLLKKGVVRQLQATPLVAEVLDEFKSSARWAATTRIEEAQKKDIVLHKYELVFINLLEGNPGLPVAEIDFSGPMKGLIKRVAKRIGGFDLSDTQDYYRQIIRRALREAQSIGEIPEREKALDRNLEWILLDDDYPTVFESSGYSYVPIWTRTPVPTGRVVSADRTVRSPSKVAASGGRTTFGDVAASFAGWAENTMGDMASAIAPGALSIKMPQGGVINLTGADKATKGFFRAMSEASGSGGGGGGGGGGGCACAGCACACACAGGGR